MKWLPNGTRPHRRSLTIQSYADDELYCRLLLCSDLAAMMPPGPDPSALDLDWSIQTRTIARPKIKSLINARLKPATPLALA